MVDKAGGCSVRRLVNWYQTNQVCKMVGLFRWWSRAVERIENAEEEGSKKWWKQSLTDLLEHLITSPVI